METIAYCSLCKTKINAKFSVRSFPQDFTIRLNCNKNHLVIVNLTNPLYSLLFDKSIIAYYDENYRSSIFEAASSLERFYEHAIRIMIIAHKDIGDMSIINAYNNTWKSIKNLTERQLGAFIMLFHKKTGNSPFLQSENMIRIRNATIHKGHLPTKEEALAFLSNVHETIENNRFLIKTKDEQAFWLLDQRVDFENLDNPSNTKGIEFTLCAHNGQYFFNSTYGFDFENSIKNYYDMCLKN